MSTRRILHRANLANRSGGLTLLRDDVEAPREHRADQNRRDGHTELTKETRAATSGLST